MASIDVSTQLPCLPSRVQALLLNEDFLGAFMDEQHPTRRDITTDASAQTSQATWTVGLPADVPGIVKKLVGSEVTLDLWIHAKDQGSFNIDARGKQTGEVLATLTMQERNQGTYLRIHGDVGVKAGLLSSQAARLARDQVIKPILQEDLFRLLGEWCSR